MSSTSRSNICTSRETVQARMTEAERADAAGLDIAAQILST